jgi:hypothetical protein
MSYQDKYLMYDLNNNSNLSSDIYFRKYLMYDLNNNSNSSSDIYFRKYQKYKQKYLNLKALIGGAEISAGVTDSIEILEDKLLQAAIDGNIDVFKELIDKHTFDEARIRDCTMEAIINNRDNIVGLLLDRSLIGINDYLWGGTLLNDATEYGQIGIIKMLLERGADINKRDTTGKTPFLLAASSDKGELESDPNNLKRKAIMKLLLDNGANINDKDDLLNLTALERWAGMDDDMEQWLVAKGANTKGWKRRLARMQK